MFGLWDMCPKDASVAWGARALIEGGSVSILHDRQSWRGELGERKEFSALLNRGPLKRALEEAAYLLENSQMHSNRAGLFKLWDRDGIQILGNTKGSCGYVYMIAYPFSRRESNG